MILELRILVLWLCLLSLSYVVAKLDYHFTKSTLSWKYNYRSSSELYFFIKNIGFIIISIWILANLIFYLFSGEFPELLNPKNK
jgi:hypothetical protein